MTVKEIYEGAWLFDEGGVKFFLLEGSERAILIDSGMQTHDARTLAEKITSLPLSLINTHADDDHLGSIQQFESFYMHPAECPNFYRQSRQGKIDPVWDGDVIDLGGRPLKIIHTPGHTPGSIAILDVNARRIFTGDPIQDGRIFMFGPMRDLHSYIHSVNRLISLSESFDVIYPSHGSETADPKDLPKFKEAAENILSNKAAGKTEDMWGNKITAYDMGFATFLCDA